MIPFFPYLWQQLFYFIYLFLNFLIIAILTGVKYLIIILILSNKILPYCQSRHILFHMLLAICVSSLEKCLLKYSAHFKNQVVCIFDIICIISLYFLYINHYLDIWFANVCSHSVGCFVFYCSFPSPWKLFNLK